MEVRLFASGDVASAMALKELAQWNQTESDWRRLLKHEPHGCFTAAVDGRVVATATTTSYGHELAWIGMMLVHPEYRRRGVATRLMQAALNYLRGEQVASVKLDATPEGRPVYERLGFEAETVIERWSGVGRAAAVGGGSSTLNDSSLLRLFELDRRAFGADRTKLLKSLIDDACVAPLVSITPEGQLSGYALTRRGATASYVGPVVAMDASIATALLDGVLDQLAGQHVFIDVNTTFVKSRNALATRGFIKQRELIRMGYGNECHAGTSGAVFAIAGPEVG